MYMGMDGRGGGGKRCDDDSKWAALMTPVIDKRERERLRESK